MRAPSLREVLRDPIPATEWEESLPGGRASGMEPDDFIASELEAGTEDELEHTVDLHTAREIAMDHLASDPHYYSHLAESLGVGNREGLDSKFIESHLGFEPIRRIAKGSYGTVYEAQMSSGQRVAVKLSRTADHAPYRAVKRLWERVPERVRKHLPRVYAAEAVKSSEFPQIDSYVVMELLRPAPPEVTRNILVASDSLGDPTTVSKIVRKAVADYNAKCPSKLRIDGPVLQRMERRALRAEAAFMRIRDAALDAMLDASRELGLYSSIELDRMWIGVDKAFRNMSIGFPNDARERKSSAPNVSRVPGHASVLHALTVLKHFGVSWDDVHQDNVMIRPSTGDIVIADLGLFDVTDPSLAEAYAPAYYVRGDLGGSPSSMSRDPFDPLDGGQLGDELQEAINDGDTSFSSEEVDAAERQSDIALLGAWLERSLKVDVRRFLGAGQYGFVYFGIMQDGRSAAIKVSEADEVRPYAAIKGIVDDPNTPDDVRRHLPRIYLTTVMDWPDSISPDDFTGNAGLRPGTDIGIIAMEVLVPTPVRVDDELFTSPRASSHAARVVASDPHATVAVLRGAIEAYNARMTDRGPIPRQAVEFLDNAAYRVTPDMARRIEGHVLSGRRGPDRAIVDKRIGPMSNDVVRGIAVSAADALAAEFPRDPHRMQTGIQLADKIRDAMTGTAVPESWKKRKSAGEDSAPGASSVVRAMKYLNSRGIRWMDLHGGNAMVRPSTGDIVVADVGLFKLT